MKHDVSPQKAVKKKATKKSPASKPLAKDAGKVQAKIKAKAVATPKVKAKTKLKAKEKPIPEAEAKAPRKKVVTGLKKATPKNIPAPSKTLSKNLRPKNFPARDAQKSFGFPDATPDLPEAYGEDRLVLMTQDPEYLFTYWEITAAQRALSEQSKRGGEEYQEALRLNWNTPDLLAPNFVLLPVSLDARKGYLHVPHTGLSYQVEIGWVSEQGHFISILGRSNRSDSPESWKQTRERLRKTAGRRSVLEYNLGITQPLGSSESIRREDALNEENGLPAQWDLGTPGSLSSSSSSLAAVKKIPAAKKSSRKTPAPKKTSMRRG